MTTPGGSLGLKGAAAPAYRLVVHVAGTKPDLQQGERAPKGPAVLSASTNHALQTSFCNPMRRQ